MEFDESVEWIDFSEGCEPIIQSELVQGGESPKRSPAEY
jgi:hypothetical protein